MAFSGKAYEIDYYNTSGLPAPTLVIRGTMNGTPVPLSVSIFAITPTRIYTVGYYYGVGTVSINLTGSLMMGVANTWISDYGSAIWPSLMAFITYGANNETWTVIAAIPYNPTWVMEKRPVEIFVNAKFNEVKPVHVTPLSNVDAAASTQVIEPGKVNGSSDPFGFTYIGSCSSSSNVAYPPTPSSTEGVSYVWVLEQCNEFEGGVPLVFIGWSTNALQNINSILINNIEGTAQSGSGLFGVLNETGGSGGTLVLVGPTYTFSNTYIIELPNAIGNVFIEYGPLNEEITTGNVYYSVPSNGFFYVGLPSYVAYVAFQEYEVAPFMTLATGVWANGTESLAPLESDFNGQYLYVYPYLDVGNGSMTGVFNGVVYMYQNYGQLLINLLDTYMYNQGLGWSPCSNAPQPAFGTTSNGIDYVEFTLSSITNTYSPNPIGWAFMFGSLLVGGYFGDLLDIVDYVLMAVGDALTIASAFVNSALFNQNTFGLSASVYINYYPSSTFYVTLIGSPQVTSITGSQSLYPMGMVINASGYYPSWLTGTQCNS
ncbi:hypothetical protein Vdis_1038 [Vulcanisaeta distributa DSM 14429]|uniref:Uncharacterized protein n=2 Tax=Vulcanisaeta distributa TaxID=164451 RepID=E1QQ55_VULDI|nr:hypothetical protein Vdis_1038 [Vulcanisaeta distributa DSM 14429]